MPSLTWHIVKKDFRYVWPWLSLWWGILAASALDVVLSVNLIFHPLSVKNQDTVAGGFAGGNWFFLAVDVLMLAMVVDAILKSDSPIDEKAFWRTRPMGKGRMFAAKIISVFLFCFVAPGAIQAAGHLVFGFSVNEYLRWLRQFLFIQGALVAVLACLAVLFQKTIKGLLFLAGLFFAYLIGTEIYYTVYLDTDNRYLDYLMWGFRAGWREYSSLLFATVMVVAALVYAGKGRRAGALALVCGLLINWTVGLHFPVPLDNRPLTGYAWVYLNPVQNDSIKLSVEPMSLVDKPQYYNQWRIYGWINNPGFPELKDSIWRITGSGAKLQWPGAKRVVSGPIYPEWGQQPAQLINAPVAIAAAGYGRLAWETAGTWRNFPLVMLNDEYLARLKKEPAQLNVNVYIEQGHLQRITDVAASVGSTWYDGMTKSRVRTITVDDDDIVRLGLDSVGPWYMNDRPTPEDANCVFLLYNPLTKECAEGVCTVGYPTSNPSFVWRQPTVKFSFARKLAASGQALPEPTNPSALQQWLAGAHLVELGFVRDQYFFVPVAFDPFVLPTAEPADVTEFQN